MGMKRDEIESMILASIPDATVDIKDLAGDDNHYLLLLHQISLKE